MNITSYQSILRVASYYSRVMSHFLRVENKNQELQVMALFHLKEKFTKHSEQVHLKHIVIFKLNAFR